MLRLRIEFPAASHLPHLDPAFIGLVGSNQEVQCRASHGLVDADGARDLIECGGFVRGVDDGFQCCLDLFRRSVHRYCSSIFDIASGPAKTASNILCFRRPMSAKSSDCTRITACMRTISKTASNATIIALRVAQVSKKATSETGSSVVIRRWRSRSIIWAMVTVSWCSSNFGTVLRRSST